jgi:predicted ATPase/class 3 adenylate cyclase
VLRSVPKRPEGAMEYRVLGSLEVLDGSGQRLALGGERQQTVLVSLLLRAGRTVAFERLTDELWEEPPETAAKTVQVYVSRLRQQLAAGAIESRLGGYALLLNGDRLDLREFEQMSEQGRMALAAGEHERAAQLLRTALGLWRGPALAGLASEALRREAERLEELRLQVLEDRLEADLGRGRERQVVADLQALVAQHPYRERLRGQLMLALYRCGRQTDALGVYRETRNLLAEELGLEPSEELWRLVRRMLTRDPELENAGPRAKAPASTPQTEQPIPARRPATVVFVDVVDSTALAERLDPEFVHNVLDRYAAVASEVLQRHGGTTEKFIGDAVVGVFGLAELHEDDALRAVRAAVELRDAVAKLSEELERERSISFSIKLGLNSGEVFVGAGSHREVFATGDPINVAARLEQAAGANEILLGERTYRLVEAYVRAEALGPLEVKGRTAKVHAWRFRELCDEEPLAARVLTPFIGRQAALEELAALLAQTREERLCRLDTVVGPAGIGKSRLARELVAGAEDAVVAVGRCLSYGEGITYHALVEIVKQLVGEDPDRGIAELLEHDEDAELVARRVRAAIGLSDEPAPAEESFWAVRRLFEAVARTRPLIAVVEDVHWAEPLLLDLLEYLVGFSAGVPIFVLCLARPELLETRPVWAAPHPRRSLVVLEALPESDAQKLVCSIGGPDLEPDEAVRLVQTGEGNPLFLEQLIAAQAEAGEREHLPPSVQAVLAARIANLDRGERMVLEHAAVEGRNFRWNSVAALLPKPEHEALGEHLMALVRRQLIQPDPSAFAGEDSFRFTHVLIRDAAYASLPKKTRADLHQRFADWVERTAGPTIGEYEATVGYHLEQAYRYQVDLGSIQVDARHLASRASQRLESAGRRALARSDLAAAINLLERSADLLDDDARQAALLPDLGAAHIEAGNLAEAESILAEAAQLARNAEDERAESRVLVQQQFLELHRLAEEGTEEAAELVERVVPIFERHGDHHGLCRARRLQGTLHWIEARAAAAAEAWQQAAACARQAGNEDERSEILSWVGFSMLYGPVPVPEGIRRCERMRAELAGNLASEAEMLRSLAGLHAMEGHFDLARSLIANSDHIFEELGQTLNSAISHAVAIVELLAGDPAAAESSLRAGYEALEEMGERAYLSTTAAYLAQAILAQGRHEEAKQLTELSEQLSATCDLATQVMWRGVRARILAGRGETGPAERLVQEAVALAERSDFLNHRADTLMDLAQVLQAAGRGDESTQATAQALGLYEEKSNVAGAAKARASLAPLAQV